MNNVNNVNLTWWKRATALVSNSRVTVLKNFYSLYLHVIRPQKGKNNKFFFPPQYSNFALSLALFTHEVNKNEGILQRPVV